jgi:NTP pyrophosphatase (non-canonical NTP hydrolase)
MDRFDDIRKWAHDRNLVEGSTPDRQLIKLDEEIYELEEANRKVDLTEYKDAIGDCIVVLTIMAAQRGLRVEDCIEAAWQEIKDRKGRMVEGIFVKEG